MREDVTISFVYIQYPTTMTPELPIVWGIPPDALHRQHSPSVLILQKVLSHHPQHYEPLVAILARERVWGERIELLLKDVFLDNDSQYNPFDFFSLLMPEALSDKIKELSEDKEWKNEWDEVIG